MSKDSKFEFHFHGSVGQQIARVDNMVVHFDKDMQMHIAQVGQTNALPQQADNEELCPYIQVERLNEVGTYTPEQFNRLLQQEATQQAPQFAKFLHKHEKSGYMNFGNHNKQQVFDTLRAYCPKMRQYTYGNFALYF